MQTIALKRLVFLSICSLSLIGVTGCEKKAVSSTVTATEDLKNANSSVSPAADAIVNREPLKPVTDYVPIEVGRIGAAIEGLPDPATTMRSMYWSKAKRDYALLAYDFLPEYRKETDTFKRSDLLKANLAKLEAAFNSTKSVSHFALETSGDSNVIVDRYDPKEKGFEVRLAYKDDQFYELLKPNESLSTPQPAWALAVLGATTDLAEARKKVIYRPKTEDEARTIEAKLARSSQGATGMMYLPATRLGHMVASFPTANATNEPTAVFVTDGVIVRAKQGREALFTIDSEQLGRAVTVDSDKVREMLGLPIKAKNIRGNPMYM